jgi:hypothetical protein
MPFKVGTPTIGYRTPKPDFFPELGFDPIRGIPIHEFASEICKLFPNYATDLGSHHGCKEPPALIFGDSCYGAPIVPNAGIDRHGPSRAMRGGWAIG